jgi:hypothetical protein
MSKIPFKKLKGIFFMLRIRALRKFIFVLLCLFYIVIYPRPQELYQMDIFKGAQVLFYSNTLPDINVDWLNNGINYEIRTDYDNAENIRKAITPLFQTVILKGDIDKVLRYLKISVKESVRINGGQLISGYSQIVRCREEGGVNVQVYCKESKIYVGSPVIEGSY